MRTTPQLLLAVMKRHNLPSHYALAKRLGVSPNRISNYRTGTSKFDEEMCVRIAQELGEPPGTILAEVAAERAKRPEVKKAWEAVARAAAAGVTALFLFVIFYGSPVDLEVISAGFFALVNTHYAQTALGIALALALAAAGSVIGSGPPQGRRFSGR